VSWLTLCYAALTLAGGTGLVHRFSLRVYYEDTDLAGIVYYANYLKFIERARTEWVASLGLDQMALKAREGVVFAVRRVEADFLRPAKFGDDLVVETVLQSMTGARLVLEQAVLRGGERLFLAVVTLVCLTEDGHAARLPAEVRARLAGPVH
jgi:acyl-CoA thioester hydrolase